MEVNTIYGRPIDSNLLHSYFSNLVNQFFKILPMRENEEDSLITYMQSLQMELFGCKSLIPELGENSFYLTLMSILQYLIDTPDSDVSVVKREVFRAISICHKLKSAYAEAEVS